MSLSSDELDFIEAQKRIFKPYGTVEEMDVTHSGQVGTRTAKFLPYNPPRFERSQIRICA